MSTPLPASATEIASGVAQAAGDSLLDQLWPWLSQHWWLPTLLVGLRIMQPLLWDWSQKTKTKWDDRLVKAIAWALGAVERKKDDK